MHSNETLLLLTAVVVFRHRCDQATVSTGLCGRPGPWRDGRLRAGRQPGSGGLRPAGGAAALRPAEAAGSRQEEARSHFPVRPAAPPGPHLPGRDWRWRHSYSLIHSIPLIHTYLVALFASCSERIFQSGLHFENNNTFSKVSLYRLVSLQVIWRGWRICFGTKIHQSGQRPASCCTSWRPTASAGRHGDRHWCSMFQFLDKWKLVRKSQRSG